MPIDVRCPDGHQISAPDRMAGRTIRCPNCSKLTTVPAAEPTASKTTETKPAEPKPREAKPISTKPTPFKSADTEAVSFDSSETESWDDMDAAAPVPRKRRPPKVPKKAEDSSPTFQYVLMGATNLLCGLIGFFVGTALAPSARHLVNEVDSALIASPTDPKTTAQSDASNPLAAKSHNLPGRISLNLRLPLAERDPGSMAIATPPKTSATTPVNNTNRPVTNPGPPAQSSPLPGQNGGPPVSANLQARRPVQAVKLDSPIHQVVVGKSGKLLIAALPESRQVVIVDVTTKKAIRTINLRNANVLIAAGESKLVVLDRTDCVISRYDLASLQRELTVACEPYRSIALGCASEGPILGVGAEFVKLNLQSLKPSRVISSNVSASDVGNLLAAANGQVFTGWRTVGSPSGMMVLRLTGETLESTFGPGDLGQIVPGSNGQVLYTTQGRYDTDGKPLDGQPDEKTKTEWVPASTGPFYLTLGNAGENQSTPTMFMLRLQNSDGDLAMIKNVALPDFRTAEQSKQQISPRHFFLPNADSFVSVVDNQLLVQRVSVKDELDKPAKPYVLAVSMPPATVGRGSQFAYNVETFPANPSTQFALDGAPQGMTISKAGSIEWKVPERFRDDTVAFTVKVQGLAGATATQKILLKVIDSARSGGDSSRKSSSTASTTKPAAKPPATPFDPKSEPAIQPLPPRTVETVALPSALTQVVVGGSGKFLIGCAPAQKQVVVIDVAHRKISKTISVDDADIAVAAGGSKLIVLQRGTGFISRYDLTSLENELTIKSEPYKSIALGSSSDGPLLAVTRTGKSEATATAISMETLEPTGSPISFPPKMDGTALMASANGKLFSSWSTTIDPNGMGLLEFDGETPKWFFDANIVGSSIPSVDGRLVYTLNRKIASTGEPTGKPIDSPRLLLPAATGPWFLTFTLPEWKYTQDPAPPRMFVQYQSDDDVAFAMSDIELPNLAVKTTTAGLLNEKFDQRFFLMPDANALAILPATMDRVQIYKFDLKEELERTGCDYLEVTSNPSFNVIRGKDLSYQIDVLCKRGNPRFELQTAPNGMSITKGGQLNWKVPTILASKEVTATVVIADDSGQEVTHTVTFTHRQPKK